MRSFSGRCTEDTHFAFDSRGIDYVATAGGGVGYGAGRGAYIRLCPDNLTHTRTQTAVREFSGADGWGWSQSLEGPFDPNCPLCFPDNASWSGGPVIGYGAGAYQGVSQTIPINFSAIADLIKNGGRTFASDSKNANSGSAGGCLLHPSTPRAATATTFQTSSIREWRGWIRFWLRYFQSGTSSTTASTSPAKVSIESLIINS